MPGLNERTVTLFYTIFKAPTGPGSAATDQTASFTKRSTFQIGPTQIVFKNGFSQEEMTIADELDLRR